MIKKQRDNNITIDREKEQGQKQKHVIFRQEVLYKPIEIISTLMYVNGGHWFIQHFLSFAV